MRLSTSFPQPYNDSHTHAPVPQRMQRRPGRLGVDEQVLVTGVLRIGIGPQGYRGREARARQRQEVRDLGGQERVFGDVPLEEAGGGLMLWGLVGALRVNVGYGWMDEVYMYIKTNTY